MGAMRTFLVSFAVGYFGTNAVVADPAADFLVKGLVTATFTPMTENGSLDLSRIPAMARYLNSTGVHWIFSGGTTGESVDLTLPERKAMAAEWVKMAKEHGQRVIVHVGADSILDAEDLALHAQSIGADAIAAMPPTFIKPSTVAGLVATMKVIAAAAPQLPFYYYHIPSMTGVDLKMADFLAAADPQIPTLRGVKFTDYNLDDLQLCMNYGFTDSHHHFAGAKANMLFGRDQMMLSAVVLGAEAAVGSTYNWNGELQNHIFTAFARGDLATARAAQLATTRLIKVLQDSSPLEPGTNTFKVLMDVLPGVPSVGPARLPYLPSKSTAARTKLLELVRVWCHSTPPSVRPSYCQGLLTLQV